MEFDDKFANEEDDQVSTIPSVQDDSPTVITRNRTCKTSMNPLKNWKIAVALALLMGPTPVDAPKITESVQLKARKELKEAPEITESGLIRLKPRKEPKEAKTSLPEKALGSSNKKYNSTKPSFILAEGIEGFGGWQISPTAVIIAAILFIAIVSALRALF